MQADNLQTDKARLQMLQGFHYRGHSHLQQSRVRHSYSNDESTDGAMMPLMRRPIDGMKSPCSRKTLGSSSRTTLQSTSFLSEVMPNEERSVRFTDIADASSARADIFSPSTLTSSPHAFVGTPPLSSKALKRFAFVQASRYCQSCWMWGLKGTRTAIWLRRVFDIFWPHWSRSWFRLPRRSDPFPSCRAWIGRMSR